MTLSSRRARRQLTRDLPSYVVAAHETDLYAVEATLADLPWCAHGVLLVVSDREELAPVRVPNRFTTRVFRSFAALERAADAWLTEMCVDTVDEAASPKLCVWFTGSVRELGRRLDHRHALNAHIGF